MLKSLRSALRDGEEGHAVPALVSLIPGAGIVILGIAAANANDTWMVIGGIIGGVGIVAHGVAHHITIDYDFYRRFAGKN